MEISNYELVQGGISTALTALGHSTDALADMMAELDNDGDQMITLADFEGIMEREMDEAESEDEVRESFQVFFR